MINIKFWEKRHIIIVLNTDFKYSLRKEGFLTIIHTPDRKKVLQIPDILVSMTSSSSMELMPSVKFQSVANDHLILLAPGKKVFSFPATFENKSIFKRVENVKTRKILWADKTNNN